MSKIIELTFIVVILFTSCKKGKNNDESCNGSSTRRSVKILTDEAATFIDTIPIVTSVDSIGNIAVPKADKHLSRQTIEQKVFSITAKVHKLSKHRDGDWKVKLTNGNDLFINCEAPNLGCEYTNGSIYFEKMDQSRKWIESHQDEMVGKILTVVGVAFIDIPHGYPRNAAKNELELHPILDIHY